MSHTARTGPPADMSTRILWRKIELLNVGLASWVRAGLSSALIRDERRDKTGLVIADGCSPMVRAEWTDPMAVAFLEMEASLVAEIGSARTAFLPLVMELFEMEELVILESIEAEAGVDERVSEPFLLRLRELGFRSPRAVLGRGFTGGVSVRYARLTHKRGRGPGAAVAADSQPGFPAAQSEPATKHISTPK